MKINPYSQIQNVYRKQVGKQQPKADVSQKRDQLQISNEAKIMQQETRISTERKERIEALKAQVNAGEYKVNAEDVARKFYDYWNER
ncbi:flagellar biosynthesis anti-sigma factor FlgM [Anaerobacillus alkaliphilus]|uniref:Negative regulator of flagellin synthesis n=1 Tax=Anaerobacillus alkaliphilus TaxID=1548597 RepID=A0A4Q0VUP7_9BACI|nr:flagellar biosynthesis anti-sigma factor FlgM [Anaerobacillus alkaliphilus]RXJ02288.1 flagellar biosynthesis anti-sigma factor FlgM [Anaerobacillus alkaliphilus]